MLNPSSGAGSRVGTAPPSAGPHQVPQASGRPTPERGDEFDRVLRQKSSSRENDRRKSTDDDETTSAPPATPAALVATPLPFAASRSAVPVPAGTASAVLPQSETASRLHRAAAGDAVAAGAAVGGLRQDAVQTFAVTLNDPRGIGLELRAERAGGAQVGAAQAPWSLTVGSGVVDASVLARHAPRLNERLQARVVTHGHVRVEGHDGARDGRDGDGREGGS